MSVEDRVRELQKELGALAGHEFFHDGLDLLEVKDKAHAYVLGWQEAMVETQEVVSKFAAALRSTEQVGATNTRPTNGAYADPSRGICLCSPQVRPEFHGLRLHGNAMSDKIADRIAALDALAMVQAGAKLVKDNMPYHTGTKAIYEAMLAALPTAQRGDK